MNPQLVLCNSQEPLPEDGILFVRNQSILSTMVRMPIIALGFVVLAIGMPIQSSLSALRTIDFIIYQDGSTHVFYQTEADPLSPDFTVKLFGDTIDYDTHDLVSKDGKIWSFTVDAPLEHTVLMPKNTVIVGMNTIPQSIEIIDEQSYLLLPLGHTEISYSFGISGSAQTALDVINDARNSIEQIKNNGIQTPLADTKLDEALTAYDNGRFTDATDLANEAKNLANQEQTSTNQSNSTLSNSIIIIIGVVAAAIASAVILKRRKNIVIKETLAVTSKQEKTVYQTLDKETIFVLRPNLRDDDKELISFIVDNGGQAYESELRKKFLQPRTTMWRAVKRLES